MKKTIAVLLAALLLVLCGCKQESPAPERHVDTPRISVILPHHDDGYWSFIGSGILDAVEQLPLDVKLYAPDLNYNVELMSELIAKQTAAQVDALIVQGIEDPGYIAALEEARAQGICIVLVDTDLTDFNADLYVGTDNREAGIQMGKRLAEVTGGRAHVAIISGDVGYSNLSQRLQGIQQVADAYPELTIDRVEYDKFDAMTVMEKYYQILSETPQVDTLVGIEGTVGQTLSQLDSTGFSHVLVFDNNEDSISGLKKGIFDGILCQQNYQMGQICIRELAAWFDTGSFSQNKICTTVDWMTLENMEEMNHGA